GADQLTYHIADGTANSQPATVSFTVQPSQGDHAPVAQNGSVQVQEDGSLIINLANFGTDADGNPLTGSVITQPTHGTLTQNANGTYTYTPNQYYYGSDSLNFTLSDGLLTSQEATLSITVAKVEIAPTLADSSATLNEGSSANLNLLASATDVNGDPVTAAIVTPPTHGTVTHNSDGTWTYTPSQHFFGTDTFTYEVSDGTAESNVATVTLNVTQVIHAPVAANDSVQTVSGTPVDIAVLANDVDVDGNPLTPIIVSSTSNGTLTVNADGTIRYTPNSGFIGTDQFTYQDNDGNGL